ncbi:MAG: hypothetical protein RIG77_19695 [Cyclobacteriaceae bacterium]
MYKETFDKIKVSKKKHEISNLLHGLSSLEPNYDFLDEIITLSSHKTPEIRWSALSLLCNFNDSKLEGVFITIVESGKKDDLAHAAYLSEQF